MLILELSGGLGNQLFQYVAGCGLAVKLNTELKFDITFLLDENSGGTKRAYELPVFNINPMIATQDEIEEIKAVPKNKILRQFYKIWRRIAPYKYRRYFNESGKFFDERIFDLPKNCYLEGYWQSEKYFKHIETELRQGLTFKNQLDNDLAKKMRQINSVSVHFRRTDFRDNVCDLDYYQKALEIVTAKINNPILFIFSDDLDFVKNNFKTNLKCVYVEGNTPVDDLQLMSLCQHNIIANSTFSWWGAWLNANVYKMVIVPHKIMENNRDIVPEEWIII